ncbi:MAG: GNAT family N-acetyltransferase [Candidatus Izemoplasmatales bacterium]
MSITYKDTINVNEVNTIRKLMGWRQDNPEQLQAALNGSAFIVAAYDKDKAIGMARLIWDGGGSASIANILCPEYKNQGIENELITRILNFLRDKLKPGFGIQVDIRAWRGQESLYESLGFQLSTVERRGIPMHICLTDQIELTDKMFKQMGF